MLSVVKRLAARHLHSYGRCHSVRRPPGTEIIDRPRMSITAGAGPAL